MPPPAGRYGPSGIAGPFPHLQQAHLQQQQQSQQHHSAHPQTASTGIPPSSLGGHPGFGLGTSGSNINPFTLPGANGMTVTGFPATGAAGSGIPDGGGTGLASHAAQMGFLRGAQMQQQQQQQQQAQQQQSHLVHDGRLVMDGKADKSRIRDVWKHNLAQEMESLRALVEKYPYISMDTEFPGIVARPMGTFTTKADYHYQTLRCNVDLLKMIQLGVTLFSEEGEVPPAYPANGTLHANGNHLVPAPCTWQFNFHFSLENDMYAQESTSMLAKAGIDFTMHEKNGIDPLEFGALLMTSGLVLLDDVHWISFHSGYDFGYLMKIMLCKPLPDDEEEFHKLLSIFFPSLYDIKFLMKHASRNQSVNGSPLTQGAVQILANLGQKSGLQDIADELGVKRVGIAHQAGSDSLVTGEIFWKMRQLVFNGTIDQAKYSGQIWGLNGQIPAMPYHTGNQPQQTPNLNGAMVYSNTATPSTPNTGHAALNSNQTPAPQSHVSGNPSLTPGGGGGVFGAFQLGRT
ncbi:CAF1 family ribonuclease containing protein [Coccidioides posadasii C735 delta SOWgp]|nr:CAF1 family ribonuclease containing protein [Coccidioides posadasii C735 delta SOWgp]EER27334.1 CAF1 family ribonuclease containing protein [Coccidioides posadasii C735 delta SOWgp]KMM67123.1 CCR4-NOT transcription complex subunit 7 [Coccidioides posadasii RMSCC 3488]|eukprot:XP_003069479.1 CAF1 family ribonuclease containing protein [Coccidioides posadasii C735 delta SOWgp]